MIICDPKLSSTSTMITKWLKLALPLTILPVLIFSGCSGFTTQSTTTSVLAPSITTSTIPNGQVGNAFQEGLSASGGTAPYTWKISAGALPPGLSIAVSTGMISGTPNQSGQFNFTVSVTDSSSPLQSASKTFTMTVAAATSALQITTASLPAGTVGTAYSASLAASGGATPYAWSTSSGSLPTGLTLSSSGAISGTPSASGTFNFTAKVTDSSSPAQSATKALSIVVSATPPPLTITTASLPAGTVGTAYSGPLAAAGGTAPYSWTLLSGALPAGLTLSTAGTIAGTPTASGTFSFQVQAKDSANNNASATLALLITPQGACGPPNYCSRTDLLTSQLPATIPSVGNLSGANTVITDPVFNNRIVRVTDANTDPSRRNFTFIATASGSADENQWNTDSTLFMSYNMNAGAYPYAFDPATMQASRLYAANLPATGGMQLNTLGEWSRANSQWWYAMGTGTGGVQIQKYDFTNRSTPPSPQLVYDFSSSPNCLGSGFTQTWSADGGVAINDSAFSMAFANTGGQDGSGANYVVVYTPGKGCRMWNTATGQVTGDWGPTGTVSIPDRVHMHNMKMSKDGNWIAVTYNNCAGTCPDRQPLFWNVPTLNVVTMPGCQSGSGACGGHWTMGSTTFAFEDANHPPDFDTLPFSNTSSLTVVDPNQPTAFTAPWDQHNAWNNTNTSDSVPFCTSSFNPTGYSGTLRFAWDQEILCFSVGGSGKVWRFAHTFNTDNSQRFSTSQAIGTVSQDGRFYIFSSDWLGALGSEGGAAACTIGSNCRGDVFIVELK